MKFHHIGIICKDIDAELRALRKIHLVNHESAVIYDELQDANLCIINVDDGTNLELISGPKVNGLLDKGIRYAHVCYEVHDLNQAIEELRTKGAVLVSAPKPAKLFNLRRVAFLYVSYGLIELIEENNE
ncbi:MAG: VOC family protein [Candidatus Omnitrophica bacterium]|nr:VOC family protein [Candidatus Omnitrophota bacterium]